MIIRTWLTLAAATLHCTHGISGLRVGTLPGVSQQNAFLGLPITLMREETAYLVSTGIAHLVPLSRPSLPSPETVAEHTARRVARIRAAEEKRRLIKEKQASVSEAAFEKGGDKARAKREARAKARAEKILAAGGDPMVQVEAPQPVEENLGYFYTVPATPLFPDSTEGEMISAIPHPLFPFPTSVRDVALVGTFKMLAGRGYRIGLGPRFGGEYLVYPGDYLRYHAHFTSQVIVRQEPIKPTEVVAWGRLGTGTKKAGLLCCWDDSKEGDETGEGEIEFYSLEWANFG